MPVESNPSSAQRPPWEDYQSVGFVPDQNQHGDPRDWTPIPDDPAGPWHAYRTVDPSQVHAITVDASQVQPVGKAGDPRDWTPVDDGLGFVPDAPHSGPMGQVGHAVANYWDQVNPIEQYKAVGDTLYRLATHPAQTLTQIGAANDAPRAAAVDAFKRGNYVEGVRHGLDWL